MPAKFKLTVDQPAWLKMIRDKQRPVATAAVAALRETAADAVQEGRRDIAAAGPNFKGRWLSGLQYRTAGAKKDGEPSMDARAIVFHKFGIAGVFETGARIEGKPLLWIPTKRRGPTASRSKMRLTSATVRGQPLLFAAGDPDPHRKPLYIGVPAVNIPKKFHITEIVKEKVRNIGLLFIKYFKDN
jgi:hypothetical protein